MKVRSRPSVHHFDLHTFTYPLGKLLVKKHDVSTDKRSYDEIWKGR